MKVILQPNEGERILLGAPLCGEIVIKTDPATAGGLAATQTVVYNDNGTVDRITDADGVFTRFSYDFAQRLTRVGNDEVQIDIDRMAEPFTHATRAKRAIEAEQSRLRRQ